MNPWRSGDLAEKAIWKILALWRSGTCKRSRRYAGDYQKYLRNNYDKIQIKEEIDTMLARIGLNKGFLMCRLG